MTFDAPLWLLLLCAAPPLWWLHRRLRAPREIVVASVDALRGVQPAPAGERPRRTLDTELVLLLAAVLCLALAAAGPRWGSGGPTVLAAIDTSASMLAPTPEGASLGDVAWREALRRVEQAAGPDAAVVAVDLAAPEQTRRVAVGGTGAPFAFAAAADDLPASLAPVLARARRESFPGVLVVTDRALDVGADVVVSGPGRAPVPRPAVLDAVLDGDDALVTVLRSGGAPVSLASVRDGSPRGDVEVPVGEGAVVLRVPAPRPGAAASYEVAASGDAAAVARLRVRRVGGVRSARVVGAGAAAPRLRTLLAALGVHVVAASLADVDVDIVVGGPPARPVGGDPPRLHLAVGPGADGDVRVVAAATVVAAARVTCSGDLADAAPTPGAALARTGVLHVAGGAPSGAWSAPDGMLAAVFPRRVVTTLDPDAPASTWHDDPSFPVFVLCSLEHLAGGPDRLESIDALPPRELVHDSPPPPPAGVERIAVLVRSATDDPASTSPAAALASLAAGLVAVVAVRGAGRFSGAGRR